MSRTPLVTFLSKVRSIDSNRVFFSMGSLFKWSFTRRRPVWIVTGNCRLAIRSKIEDSHQLYICNNFLIIYYMKGIPFLPVCKSQNYIVILLSRYLFRLYFEHMSSKMFVECLLLSSDVISPAIGCWSLIFSTFWLYVRDGHSCMSYHTQNFASQ